MESIILLIADQRLRQLYHELLLCENIEITPIAKIENAMIIASFEQFNTLIVYPDDFDWKTMEMFLHLQKKIGRFAKIRIILLTSDPEQYNMLLSQKDLVINISRVNPDDIVKKIKQALRIMI